MHSEAFAWIARYATEADVSVLDIGGRNINGTPRPLFPNATSYTVLDILPGVGVDIVVDAATWTPSSTWDVVVAAEVFEHAASWSGICRTAYGALRPGGRFIITTAAPGRPIHSGVDGGPVLHPGEHYGNIPASELKQVLNECGFVDVVVDSQPSPADTRAVATK